MKKVEKETNMNRVHFSIGLPKNVSIILDNYCKNERRSKSNMLEVMIIAYDELHKTKY